MVDHAPWWTTEKWRAFAAVGFSYTTIVMSMSMSFIVLPSIAETFDVTLRAVGWVVIIESFVVAALLLPLGGLSDTIGRRRVLIAGLVVFAVGSVFTGLAPTFALLIISRVVMSFGNAMVQSVGTGVIVAAFPPEERGRAIGAQSFAVAIGAATGPLIGGFALEVISWEVLFILVAVPTALSAFAVVAFIGDDTVRGDPRTLDFDFRGSLLSILVVVLAVLTISNPGALRWDSPVMIGGLAGVVILGTIFVRWELSQDRPMFELRLFSLTDFRAGTLARILGFVGATVTSFLLPIYLLTIRGLSEARTGVMLFIIAIGLGVSGPIAGRVYDRVGARSPTMFGLLVQATTALAFSSMSSSTPTIVIAMVVLAHGLGIGFWIVPNNGAILGAVPPKSLGLGGAFTNVTRTLGNVLGQAAATAIVVGVMTSRGFDIPLADIDETAGASSAFLAGWRATYIGAALLALATMPVVRRLPSARSAR